MISSSWLIKILGCAVGAFVTIGIPVITRNEIKKNAIARQVRQIKKFFNEVDNSAINTGETFSDEAFNNWVPNKQEQKIIADTLSTKVQYLPEKFFEPYLETFISKPKLNNEAPNICYLRISDSKEKIIKLFWPDRKFIYIPFPKAKVTHTGSTLMSTVKGFETNIQLKGPIVPIEQKHEWDSALQKTDFTKIFLENSKGKNEDKKKYQEILFLEELYNVVSTRLSQLGYHKNKTFWTYDSKDCSPAADSERSNNK